VSIRVSARLSLGSISLDALLSVQSDDLLGPAREPRDDSDEIGFSVYSRPDNETIITLSETCDLRTVFNRCREIEAAILDNGDPRVTFTRDENEGAYRLAQFGRTHLRSVCNVCAELLLVRNAMASRGSLDEQADLNQTDCLQAIVACPRQTESAVVREVWDSGPESPAGSTPAGRSCGYFTLETGGKLVWTTDELAGPCAAWQPKPDNNKQHDHGQHPAHQGYCRRWCS
jgi:hypothetical protein